MTSHNAKYSIGQIVDHQLFGYRGVVFDVDPCFSASDEWYETMARSRPPKDAPWYHVLVDNASHTTYVAERNLGPSAVLDPVRHPLVDELLGAYANGNYARPSSPN